MNQTQCTTKKRKFQHLSYAERKIIEKQLKKGMPKSQIARLLNRNISTIKREIIRGTVEQIKQNPYFSKNPSVPAKIKYNKYFADVGQRRYEKARKNCGAKCKLFECIEFVEYAESMILSDKKWSPDTVIGYAKKEKMFENIPSTKTFYNWIESGLCKVKNIDLMLKTRRKPKTKIHQSKRKLGKSIDERPKCVDDRLEFGHWEGDGIVGKNHKGHLITLVERKTGIGLIYNAIDKKSQRVVDILKELKRQFGNNSSEIFKTITFDNGNEFAQSDAMENAIDTSIYYAHPYSAWERGINENWNGLVRRFVPKGSSFDHLTDDVLQRINNYINTMPRKRLNYKTPFDLWNEEISAILSS